MTMRNLGPLLFCLWLVFPAGPAGVAAATSTTGSLLPTGFLSARGSQIVALTVRPSALPAWD